MDEAASPLASSYGGIVAIGNLKGGVGKSTIAVGIAGAMARAGKSVALVDSDPQATSRRWLAGLDLPIGLEALDLDDLASLESWLGRAERLVRAYGTVLVDLPAVIGPAMASAFLLARVIVVPVSLSPVDIDGTRRVLRYIKAARDERSGHGPEVLIVPNKLPRSVGLERSYAARFAELGESVAPGLSLYPEHGLAFAAGCWIGDFAPGSPPHLEIAALEAAVAECLARASPAPRLEVARERRRERERASRAVAAVPTVPAATAPGTKVSDRGPGQRWWRRLFAA